MYRIFLVFLALLLWGCPKHTPTITELPLTDEIEQKLYNLISCARFDLDKRAEFEESGYYYVYNACPIEGNPFGWVDVYLFPKDEQFDLKVVQAAMYRGDEQKWVDVIFNPIKDMSPEQIAQHFNVMLVVMDKKYLQPSSDPSGYEAKIPAKYAIYSLKDGKWTKAPLIEISDKLWKIYNYIVSIDEQWKLLMKPDLDRVHITDIPAFVRRIESAGDYRKDQEKAADLNGDGYKDHIFVFTPQGEGVEASLYALLLSEGEDNYRLLYDLCYYPSKQNYSNHFNLVTKGKYFTIEHQIKNLEEDSDDNQDYYITFQVEKDKALLHRLGIISYKDGKKEQQFSTKDFGEIPFEHFSFEEYYFGYGEEEGDEEEDEGW